MASEEPAAKRTEAGGVSARVSTIVQQQRFRAHPSAERVQSQRAVQFGRADKCPSTLRAQCTVVMFV